MRRTLFLLAVALATLGASAAPLAAQVPPDGRWSTFDTEHFRVHFHDGLEPFARRAADRAERAHALLAAELAGPPAGPVHLVVANNVDYANGYATPIPRNRLVIYAHPPVDEPSLAYFDDWLELLVLHELVHAYHLDRAGGIWARLRAVFGRSPILFPQVFTAGWVTEGLATYYESALTGAGRVRGTAHEMVLRAAVLEDEHFSIDRASGDPITWPGASTRYVYGSLFLDHLARTRGPDSLAAFVERYGRQAVPYRLDAAARRTLGVSFTRAWEEWEDSLRSRYGALADSLRAAGLTEPELLTRHGRTAAFPRHHPGGDGIVYAAADGREQPALRRIAGAGGPRNVAAITTVGPPSWLPGGRELLYAQLDHLDPYRVYADLHRVDAGGDRRRLTRGARLWEADAHPDGRRVVAVGDAGGSNALVVHDLGSGESRPLVPPDPHVHWSLPRWSPAGDRIAVGRWARGRYDVVVLDEAGALVRELTSDRAVDDAPAWSPDGRYVVFSSDRSGIANLYAYDLEGGGLRQVTSVLTGAFQPDVSPDGRWIAFSYYRADGYHIARLPFEPARWRDPAPLRPEAAATPATAPPDATAGGPARDYSALATLLPTSWAVVADGGTELGPGFGAALFGQDVVERHQWAADLLVYPDGGRVEAAAGYGYAGLVNPVLVVAASQGWSVDFAAGEIEDPQGKPVPSALLRREREVGASLTWRAQRFQSVAWLGVGGQVRDLHREWDGAESVAGVPLREIPLDLGARAEAGWSSARGFAYSVGPQRGFHASGAVEAHRYAEPFPGLEDPTGYTRYSGRGRAFAGVPGSLPGFARHVLALRADLGAETGSRTPGLRVGGTGGGSAGLGGALDLDAGIEYPVRGYPSGAQEGDRAFSATAEYRFPLRLVERGYRLLPVFLTRLWGTAFVDVGGAWCASDPGACDDRFFDAPPALRPLPSVGAELVADVKLGFLAGLPLRLGAALPLRDPYAGEPEVYLRVGRSF